MCRKKQNNIMGKFHSAREGKGGFTLVELSIVMALLAILTTMIFSFSVLMNQSTAESKEEYAFLEDCAILKENFSQWLSENDSADAVFVAAGGRLDIVDTDTSVLFSDGTLLLGKSDRVEGLDALEGVSFSTDQSTGLIKCSVYRLNEKNEREYFYMVFYPRCGSIGSQGGTS